MGTATGDFVYYKRQPCDRPIGDEPGENMLKQLTERWACMWVYKGFERRLTVPVGYIYDGASVPRWAWSVSGLTPDGMIRAASLAHDAAYRADGGNKPDAWAGCTLTNQNGNAVLISRKEADWVFRENMRFAGMKKRQCTLAWLAVRIGGKRHWGGPMPTIG